MIASLFYDANRGEWVAWDQDDPNAETIAAAMVDESAAEITAEAKEEARRSIVADLWRDGWTVSVL